MKIGTATALACITLALAGCKTDGNLTGQKGSVATAAPTTDTPVDSSIPSDEPVAAETTAPAGPTRARLGGSIHVTDDTGLDVTVTLASALPHRSGKGVIAEPPANGLFVAAKFIISDTSGSYDFNPLYLKFQTTDGTTYGALDGHGITAGFEPGLGAGNLNAGQRTGGYVTFDVPSAHGIVQLTDPLGGVVGEWTV